jgi:type VI protein secretion system component VasF
MSETQDDENLCSDPGVEAAWILVLKRWDDPSAHKRFLTLCHAVGTLAFAGGQYREVVNAADEREAVAREQIDAVIALASAELFADRPAATPRAPIARIVMTIVSGSALLYSIRMLMEFL